MDEIMHSFPAAMTQIEKQWLATALKLDFPGREVILNQITTATIQRTISFDSVEIFFNDVTQDTLIHPTRGDILFIDAFRRKGIYVEAELISFDGKVDSFYIYTPDASQLVLSDIPLDDVQYAIYAYEKEAVSLAEEEAFGRERLGDGEERTCLSLHDKERLFKPELHKLLTDLSDKIPGINPSIGTHDIGYRSLSFVIDLGVMGSNSFQGVFQCSLIGDFYFMYVIKDGFDHLFSKHNGGLSHQQMGDMGRIYNYPHGARLQAVRTMLEKIGYKPLYDFMLSREIKMCIPGAAKTRTASLLDALFAGRE